MCGRWAPLLISTLLSAPVAFGSPTSHAPSQPSSLQQQNLFSHVATADWAQGKESWQLVRDSDQQLWEEENSCDVRALRGSAPLTVLFGLSTFWRHVQKQRQETGSTAKPLEIHVLGAAYPFEGRSDWSLLATRRPAGVPAVRVVLVLGTPWHADNVPEPEKNRGEASLLQLASHPVAGRWSDKKEELVCKNDAELEELDTAWKKADFCRDHGNGLEVVCIEKYYQDASAQLPKPDVAVMFSPGFPQLARRSWDQVLRGLLDDNVVVMVGDLVNRRAPIAEVFSHGKPGGPWTVEERSDEDGMTLIGMNAYGARRLGTRRSPFPILIKHGDTAIAKNSVLQVFRGRVARSTDQSLPSASTLAEDAKFVRSVDWKKLFKHERDEDIAKEYRDSLLVPTSAAYEKAMRIYYTPELRSRAQDKSASLTHEQRERLTRLGLLGNADIAPENRKRWGPRTWVFVTRTLDAMNIF